MPPPHSSPPISPSPDGPEPLDVAGRVFFHGTSKRNARKILKGGFRDGSWTAETPLPNYKAKRGIARWTHGGFYGRGTYVTCNWRSALYFGPVLFQVERQPGTRILRLHIPPDGKAPESLKRKFGRKILTTSPWKVMSANKRLTLDEAIQLARHHVARWEDSSWANPRTGKHEKLMFDLRNILVRYGIQGWGEPRDLGGMVIFATDQLKVREVALSLPTEDMLRSFNDTETVVDRYASQEALTRTCLTARNRGAGNTRRWVEKSNEELRERFP